MITETAEFDARFHYYHGLILIDCWECEDEKFFVDRFYINLIQLLQNISFFPVINCSSNLKLDLDDASISNTISAYSHQHDMDDACRIIHNLVASCQGNKKTSHLVQKYLFCKYRKNTIFLISPDDLLFHTQHASNNTWTNWLVVGQSWQLCTHTAGLGLQALSDLNLNKKINFFAIDHGFCKIDGNSVTREDFDQDALRWKEITGFGYQLIPHG